MSSTVGDGDDFEETEAFDGGGGVRFQLPQLFAYRHMDPMYERCFFFGVVASIELLGLKMSDFVGIAGGGGGGGGVEVGVSERSVQFKLGSSSFVAMVLNPFKYLLLQR